MADHAPAQEWWTAAELAEAGLPDVPGTKRGVNIVVDRLGWQGDPARARRRKGRGGGWEYHWSLLPSRAQAALLAQVAPVAEAEVRMGRDEAWSWFEGLKDGPKDKARRRLDAIQRVEMLVEGGLTKDQAVRDIARAVGVSAKSIWNWFALIEGVRSDDRLPYLAPRTAASRAPSRAKEPDPEFMDLVLSDYLRPEQPSLKSVHRRAVRVAAREGIEPAPYHTVQRALKRRVSPLTVTLARKGVEALKRLIPAQERDKTALHAMEAVNGDFHRFDVFVRWPGEDTPVRPQMVAFQDIYSGRILAYRVDLTPNAHAVQLCVGDMIETWGIPEHVLLDNGREFAAKSITGGTPTRFRFKVRDDDVPGLLTSLGCEIHWATPYAGQSKPIERAFRDLCDAVAKDPRFAGAYTGNAPHAKPENYASRAIPLKQFLEVLAEGIEEHNTRAGRRSEVAYGRSFAEVFDESYATAPIRKATAAQRRLWLMAAEGLKPNATDGSLRLHGNRYWAEFLYPHRGEKLVCRFDTADLWSGIHVYTLAGEYLGHAECLEKSGFFDIDEAKTQARLRSTMLKAERDAVAAHRKLTAAELGQRLTAAAPEDPRETPPEAKVVRLPKPALKPAPAPREESAEDAQAQAALVADMAAIREAKTRTPEDEREVFARALDLERKLGAGEEITRDQRKWLSGYQSTAEYRGLRGMMEEFGEDALFK